MKPINKKINVKTINQIEHQQRQEDTKKAGKDNILTLQEQGIEEKQDMGVDNKLELLKYTSQVQSRIKKDITSEFTLAKFNEKDKEFIIEHTVSAYFAKKVIEMQKQRTKWDYDKTEHLWIERKQNEKETDTIQNIANAVFDSFMNRIYMVAITNRNVDANHLLRYLSGMGDDGQPIENDEDKEIGKKLKRMISKNEEIEAKQ